MRALAAGRGVARLSRGIPGASDLDRRRLRPGITLCAEVFEAGADDVASGADHQQQQGDPGRAGHGGHEGQADEGVESEGERIGQLLEPGQVDTGDAGHTHRFAAHGLFPAWPASAVARCYLLTVAVALV